MAVQRTFVRVFDTSRLERTTHNAGVDFRLGTAATTPTTVHYRIDDLTTNTAITPWTSVSPDSSITIQITSSENRMIDNSNKFERRQITVAANKGTDDETRGTTEWRVENIGGFDE